MIFKMLFDHLNMLYLTRDFLRICGMDSRLIPRCFFSLASSRLETYLNKSWNFWFWKCFFGVWTPIFQPQRAPNFMETYMELGLILVDLQQESRISALRLLKQYYELAKKTVFSNFGHQNFAQFLQFFYWTLNAPQFMCIFIFVALH